MTPGCFPLSAGRRELPFTKKRKTERRQLGGGSSGVVCGTDLI